MGDWMGLFLGYQNPAVESKEVMIMVKPLKKQQNNIIIRFGSKPNEAK